MINVAMIGVGAIADVHIQAFQQFSDRCRIVALVDRDPGCVKAKRERFNLPITDVACYDSWQEMLDEMTPDLAVICLPPYVHAPATVDLLDAGVNVLLEKPMAPTLAECDLILDAANAVAKCSRLWPRTATKPR